MPPYAIVVGNPGKVVKYRFEPTVIEKLLAIAWWDWSDKKIDAGMDFLLSDNINDFIIFSDSAEYYGL